MTLKDLGYNSSLENYRKEHHLDSFEIGRVISEHKERYILLRQLQMNLIPNY